MLPPGADAVVIVEETDERDGRVLVYRPVRPGSTRSGAARTCARATS